MNEIDPLAVELAGTTLIEASAGTGKTYTITTLFVRLLLERELRVGEILVVTYTNAATADLRRKVRDRIAIALRAIEHGDTTDDTMHALATSRVEHRVADAGKLRAALLGFDEAAIFTIHGFCQRVLQEHAFESAVAFDTELTTDQTALIDEVVRDYWAARLSRAPDLVVRAVRTDPSLNIAALTDLAKKVALHRDVPVLPEQVADDVDARAADWLPAFETAAATWRDHRDAILTRLRAALPSLHRGRYTPAKLDDWAAALDALVAGGAAPPLSEASLAAVQACSAARLAGSTNRGGRTPAHPFFDACDRLAERDAALGQALAQRVLRLRVEFVDYARRELADRKAAANVQFFDDLVQRVADALAAAPAAADGGLAAVLRRRYPAALIDEFQDTDRMQYAIFRDVYHAVPGTALILIGDPKQSIYTFRGADLFAYLDARADAGARAYTLTTSRRSDPRYLDALNALFGVSQPFFLPGIDYAPIAPAPNRSDGLSPEWPALQVLYMSGTSTKEPATRRATAGAAREIVRLLHAQPALGAETVRPHHIAVLCRTNNQARDMQLALAALGVRSVLQGDASVFESRDAEEMQRLLVALADPTDASALRAALATGVLGVDAHELLALQGDEIGWEAWVARVQGWHECWLERSFMAAFRQVLDDCRVPERLLARADGERRMTNLLHLAELLQRAAAEERRGPLALVEWLAEMRRDAEGAAAEAAQVRLESDESVLTLLTIHKAKGLEYEIVFVPFAWDGMLQHKAEKHCPLAHDPARGNRLVLDLGSDEMKAHRDAAEREARAENLRLLYVALTRAKRHCTIVWTGGKHSEHAAFGYLVHRPAAAPSADAALAAAEARIKSGDDAELRADLHRLAARAPRSIAVAELSTDPIASYREDRSPAAPPQARVAVRRLDLRWRTSSFTGLAAAGGGRLPIPVEEGLDRDELADDVGAGDASTAADATADADFPGGRRAGQLVHKLLELIDGRQGASEVRELIARLLPAFGVDAPAAPALERLLADVFDAPLDTATPALRLRDLDPARRLAELEFMMTVAPSAGALSARALARTFARHAAPALAGDYAERLARLGFAPLQGYLHGFIDLVCEHGGRWYVLDYKSNRLAGRDAYAPARLAPVMTQHHYVLQYHLYAVAVHRYLRRRRPGYDYERDFGGVYYLFVRGMGPRRPFGSGVFHDRPPAALIAALSDLIERPGGAPA